MTLVVLNMTVESMYAAGEPARPQLDIVKAPFGETPSGEAIDIYTLTNAAGMSARIMTYGAIVVSLQAPDRDGNFDDVTLGFDTLDGYFKDSPYFGAIVGRYGNRIGDAKFVLDGETYTLARNNGPNALHGGVAGFDKRVWDAKVVRHNGQPALELSYVSEDGEEGYPGKLRCEVTYSLNNQNELTIEYRAKTNEATPLNLTNHTYFNLRGHQRLGDILGHELTLNANWYTPVDDTLIPTGEILSVKGTPMDFTSPHPIGERINSDDPQIKIGGGYDHNFVLNKIEADALTFGGRVYEPESGRVLEFYTTQPGVQFYSGNFLDGSNVGKGGVAYQYRYGFCLETQHFPDSPNKSQFPSTILHKNEDYHQVTMYRFSAR
ncbi:MAG: galactose-1-epimerase [bacterium]|nr:galactose-1-epimerase [bacterium]